ncbi:RNA-binding protein [Streptomyces sp. NBC_01136]|nr:RNA-binding protein [Streptomyces sp. NBC_01136]
MLALTATLLSGPRRFFRSYSAAEIGRLITKTIEVRVKYPHLADLAAGGTIRFRIKGTDETCEVRIARLTEYADFAALLDGEGAANVNPTATRDQQLANIRAIYPP